MPVPITKEGSEKGNSFSHPFKPEKSAKRKGYRIYRVFLRALFPRDKIKRSYSYPSALNAYQAIDIFLIIPLHRPAHKKTGKQAFKLRTQE